MKCPFNIKASNGKNSELFKSILTSTSNIQEAIDLYYYTKTEPFLNSYGDWVNGKVDKNKLDANGEPKWDSLSKEKFIYDVDYNKIELDNSAASYKKIAELKPKLERDLHERITDLESMGNPEHKNTIKHLRDILATVENGLMEDSVLKFIENSKKHITLLRGYAVEENSKKRPNIEKLAGYLKAAKSYTIINQIQTLLLDDVGVQEILQLDANLSVATSKIADIEGIYINRAKDFIAEQFAARNSTWTKSQVRKWLTEAPEDIKFLEQTLGYLGDSKDMILAMTGNVVMEAEHKARAANIEFNYALEDALVKLEKKYPKKNVDELFSDMIYQNDVGEMHILNLSAINTNGKVPAEDAMYNKVQKLKSKPEEFEFFVFFYESYMRSQNMLPAGKRLGTRLPTVLKPSRERLQGKTWKEKRALIEDDISKTIKRSNNDMSRGVISDSTGEPVKRIPIFYDKKYDSVDFEKAYNKKYEELKKLGKSEEDAVTKAEEYAEDVAIRLSSSYITKDLAYSLQSFHSMAMNFATKNEIINILDAVKTVVSSDSREYVKMDASGKNPLLDKRGHVQTVKGSRSNAAKMLSAFLDAKVYNRKDVELGVTDVWLLGKVDNAKVLRLLNNSTSMVALAGNIFAGIPNIGNGEFNSYMEARGGEYYKVKNYLKAGKKYRLNLSGVLGDIGKRNPSNFINLMDQKYNMLQEFYATGNIKATEQTSAKRLMKTNLLFFINNVGEHFMQIKASMAAMDSITTYSKDGTEIGTLLDAHSEKDGRLVITPNIFVKNKSGELVKYNQEQMNRMSNKMHAVNRKLFGNYNELTSNYTKQDARLALVTKFRDWAYEGAMRRFSVQRPNLNLEQDVEGFYRTGARVAKTMLKDIKTLKISLMKENWAKLTPHEKANVRRLVTEIAVVTALGVGGGLLAYAGKNIEDDFGSDSFEDRLALGSFRMLVYEVNRLYTELFSYINPAETLKIMRSPMASTSILENTSKLIMQTLTDPFGQYETGWRKGEYKVAVKAEKLIPLYKQLTVLNPDGIKDKGTYYKF